MQTEQLTTPDSLTAVVDAIRAFPVEREVTHCEQTFAVSPFAFYGVCPACGVKVKVRSFAAVPELEDVFDAVFEWMNQPGAAKHAEARRQELSSEDD
jgi:hypothetical protein